MVILEAKNLKKMDVGGLSGENRKDFPSDRPFVCNDTCSTHPCSQHDEKTKQCLADFYLTEIFRKVLFKLHSSDVKETMIHNVLMCYSRHLGRLFILLSMFPHFVQTVEVPILLPRSRTFLYF